MRTGGDASREEAANRGGLTFWKGFVRLRADATPASQQWQYSRSIFSNSALVSSCPVMAARRLARQQAVEADQIPLFHNLLSAAFRTRSVSERVRIVVRTTVQSVAADHPLGGRASRNDAVH